MLAAIMNSDGVSFRLPRPFSEYDREGVAQQMGLSLDFCSTFTPCSVTCGDGE
jgi:hypothetical protein